jgi:hypothetical protein
VISRPVSISLETYTFLIKKENLGEVHSTLIGGDRWYPPDVRADRDRRVLDELRSQGLTSGNHLSDEFMDMLTVIQRAAVEYFTFATVEGSPKTYRTASIGRDAVLVSHSFGGEIELESIPHDQMRVRLAAALPTTPAARVHSATCSLDDLKAIYDNQTPAMTNSVRDAKRIVKLLEEEQLASGELHVALRDGVSGGQRISEPPVPLWIDTEQGRLLLSHDRSGWVNVTGADLYAISELLATMEEQLRR